MKKLSLQSFRPLGDKILVSDLERGASVTDGGIIIPDDNGSNRGIRTRWGRVTMVGPEVEPEFVKPGDWVMIEHGRWTYSMDFLDEETGETVKLWHVDNKALMIASEDDPRPRSAQF